MISLKKIKEANDSVKAICNSERKSRFIIEKDCTTLYLDLYLRADRMRQKYIRMVKNNEERLLDEGWSIGDRSITYPNQNIFIHAELSNNGSCIKLSFRFCLGDNIQEDIEKRIKIIKKTLKFMEENINNIRTSMDVIYYCPKYISMSEDDFSSILDILEYEKITNLGEKYRTFKIVNDHNVTNAITVTNCEDKIIEVTISINIENIVVNEENIKDEIMSSIYFYDKEYARLHYAILKKMQKGR